MLPRRQAGAIREELEGHLQERVRDLMVGGMTEAEATKRAIAELGEAAELAGKYRALSSEPQRRLVMYGMIVATAGAALALGVAAVSGVGRQPQNESVKANAVVKDVIAEWMLALQPQVDGEGKFVLKPKITVPGVAMPASASTATAAWARSVFQGAPAAPELDSLRVDVAFDKTAAQDVFNFVGEKAGMPVQVNWGQMAELGLEPKTPVTLQAKAATAEVILRAINESSSGVRDDSVDWRAANGVIEVASRSHFDRREVKLVIYELEGIIAARRDSYGEEREKVVEEVVGLISDFVYPSGWQDNGGDLAKLTVVGDRMFVQAPGRFHKQIAWMLEQLPTQKPERQGAVEQLRRVPLHAMDATEAAELSVAAMSLAPRFALEDRIAAVTAVPEQNAVVMKATDEGYRAVREILTLIDVPAGEVRGGPESRKFNLRHVSPRALREWLGRVFNASPGLKQCAVPRVMACDESDKTFELTATPDQVETVAKLISVLDRRE